MTRLRALIVDDEALARRYLAELVRATGTLDPVAAVAGAAEAEQVLAEDPAIDVAFLDVRLIDRPGDSSGLTLARTLAARPGGPAVVIATALPEHALAAFDLGAADYLMKPHTQARVDQCATRLVARRAVTGAVDPPAPPRRLAARGRSALVFIATADVRAFEARDRLTYVHHPDGTYLLDVSLAILEQQLGAQVLRVHRNWLVSRARVRELRHPGSGEATVLLDGNLEVPISRDRAVRVREALLAGAVGLRRE